jgi:N-acetylneuraminate synthase
MKQIKINNFILSENSPVLFIAEIGINHNGSLANAKKLIDMADLCGVNAVKFQKRTPEKCIPEKKKNQIYETPWGDIPYLEYRKKVEFGEEEYREIDKYCRNKNMIWFASAWDIQSVDFLEKFDLPCYKIASAKLTDRELLEKIRDLNKPIFLSVGMSSEEEIDKSINILKDSDLIIMHCNSSYPTADEEINLNYINTLKKKYPNYYVGYSGHEFGISASLIAVELGAKVVERHITLDRAMWGSDQAASLEYSGLNRLIRDIRKIGIWKGNGIKKVTEAEKRVREKLRNKDTL